MSIRFFYDGHEYTTDEQVMELAAALAVQIDEPAGIVSSTFKLMYESFLRHDFKSPPVQMAQLCDVLAEVARLRGESYLK